MSSERGVRWQEEHHTREQGVSGGPYLKSRKKEEKRRGGGLQLMTQQLLLSSHRDQAPGTTMCEMELAGTSNLPRTRQALLPTCTLSNIQWGRTEIQGLRQSSKRVQWIARRHEGRLLTFWFADETRKGLSTGNRGEWVINPLRQGCPTCEVSDTPDLGTGAGRQTSPDLQPLPLLVIPSSRKGRKTTQDHGFIKILGLR